MLLTRTVKNKINFTRSLSTALQQEVTKNEVEYPPIQDLSYPARRSRKIQQWYDKIQRCPTIEEKIIELNIKRYYGYKCIMMNEKRFPYNPMPFVQYVTKTDFQELNDGISDENEGKKIDSFLDLIKSDIVDAFEFELDSYK
jgi:small subunit ribosomal protein S30